MSYSTRCRRLYETGFNSGIWIFYHEDHEDHEETRRIQEEESSVLIIPTHPSPFVPCAYDHPLRLERMISTYRIMFRISLIPPGIATQVIAKNRKYSTAKTKRNSQELSSTRTVLSQ